MAAIEPSQPRAATVIAAETTVLLKLPEPALSELAERYPQIWRRFAKELAHRLEQRNAFVARTHEKIRVFIISSAEALDVARAVQNAFEYDPFDVTIWTNGVFRASWYPVETLEAQLDDSDFAIAIAQPDDITESRGVPAATARDNVIFELGMFIGRLGRKRSLLLEPRGEEIKLPSDLSGITTIPYRHVPGKNMTAAIAPACNHIREIIADLGPNN
jgi:predicted nucleotide-binding protein